MDIQKEIKRICIVKKWKIKDVAKRLNITPNYLHQLKQGRRANVNQLEKIYKLIREIKDEPSNFSDWVKLQMSNKGISKAKLCSLSGIKESYLNGIISGYLRNPEKIRLVKEVLK